MVGLNGLEPSTSRLSGVRSNQLSYRPKLSYNAYMIKRKTKSFKTKQNKAGVESKLICLAPYFLKCATLTKWFDKSFPFLPRKEVIHPHVLVGIPCYDFTPIICPTLDGSPLSVRPPASGITNSHGVTGGVYKTRERIHRNMLIYDY